MIEGRIIMNNILIKLIGLPATILHEDPCAFGRYQWMKKNIKKGSVRTLDAGCGLGTFALYAASQKNHVVGISYDQRANEKAKTNAQILRLNNILFKQGDLRRLDKFSKDLGLFDQIICFETVEHILNDEKLIKDLASLLKVGGRLLLTTPYKNYKRLWGDKLSQKEDGGHVRWGYSHEEIEELFKKANLKIEKKEYVSGFISQQLTNAMRILSKINQRMAWTITLPLRLLQFFDPFITKIIRYPFLSISVIGKKVVGKKSD